jgi:site-specific DNA recombinase
VISKPATNGKAKAQRADEVRCALYTRQSVSDGKEEFSSLDAQREAAEAFVKSQRARGWTALPTRYDDAGISGATAERPALKRLLDDVEAGLVDCVVVYKIDRLSRSIADFVQMMDQFDKKGVAFAAVTQQFDTSTSVGRLTLNLLSCFAQYEREVIAERTRDKIHAARRRGRWTGGPPPLGYDVVPEGGRIVVNEAEAKLVRKIFALHAERETVTRTVEALNQRGLKTKAWTTRAGRERPGGPWTKDTLGKLLANPVYVGRVGLQGEDFEGEHPAIVDPAMFARAQEILAQRTHKPGKRRGGRRGAALLSGLLRCAPCNATMGMTWTRRGTRVHRYYLCRRTQKEGWKACPHPSVPAHDIESLVVEQIRAVGRDAGLQARVLDAVREQGAEVDPADLRRALTLFEPVWEVLHIEEQARVIRLLVECVSVDGAACTAVISFHATGIQGLAEELAP